MSRMTYFILLAHQGTGVSHSQQQQQRKLGSGFRKNAYQNKHVIKSQVKVHETQFIIIIISRESLLMTWVPYTFMFEED